MFKKVVYCFVLFLFLGVAGCGQDISTTPLPTTQPTAVVGDVIQATGEASPTAAAPTNTTTPLPPPTFALTATPIPAATATLAATATPTPVSLSDAADFGPDRNPLTGELVEDPAVLQRRPLAVKISNSPAQYTRPQAGLSQADLVFEHATEGPITRFTAILYSQTPPDVGPIRSARLIDVEIPAMYDAALAYSGSSIGVSSKLGGSDIRPRLLRSNEPGYYRTGEDKPWEHTLHGDPSSFWESLENKGENHAPTLSAYMAFSSEPPEGDQPASAVTVKYRDFTTVEWRFDPETGRYWRWVDGEPHTDANNDEQITAANVVIVFATHQLDMSICEFQQGDVCHAFSTEIQIWGQGDAIIIRDGRQYAATWRRENRSDMLTFYDDAGKAAPLQIGNTWFQVVPYHYTDPVTITP